MLMIYLDQQFKNNVLGIGVCVRVCVRVCVHVCEHLLTLGVACPE